MASLSQLCYINWCLSGGSVAGRFQLADTVCCSMSCVMGRPSDGSIETLAGTLSGGVHWAHSGQRLLSTDSKTWACCLGGSALVVYGVEPL